MNNESIPYIVYCFTNIINNKKYVGITYLSLSERWDYHVKDSKYGSMYLFHRAIKKYPSFNWKGEILEKVIGLSKAKERERFWIKHLGLKHSEETKLKLSIIQKGKKKSKEEIEKRKKSLLTNGKNKLIKIIDTVIEINKLREQKLTFKKIAEFLNFKEYKYIGNKKIKFDKNNVRTIFYNSKKHNLI